MKQYDEEWQAVNTLLSFLRSSNVVELVHDFYAQYNNPAPAKLLEEQIELVQKHLDNAEKDV
jgi:hypothetical protein